MFPIVYSMYSYVPIEYRMNSYVPYSVLYVVMCSLQSPNWCKVMQPDPLQHNVMAGSRQMHIFSIIFNQE